MAGRGRVAATRQTASGANVEFKDRTTGRTMGRGEFVARIKAGEYTHHHVRVVKGQEIPVSNPDDSEGNNLG